LAKGGWAFAAADREILKKVPANPEALLGELPKQYAVAVRASVKNLPAAMRQQFVAQLEMGSQAAMQKLPDEDETQYAARTTVAKQGLKKIEEMANDLDEVLLGLNMDKSRGTLYLDCRITAKAGTKIAGAFAQMKNVTTNFAGFLMPEAAVMLNAAGTIADSDLAQVKAMLSLWRASAGKELDNSSDLSKEQAQVAKKLLSDALDVLDKTAEAKKIDYGAAVSLEPGAATGVAGILIAGGDKLDKVVKQLVAEIAKDQPDIVKSVKLDAETYEGVRFHLASVPVTHEELVPAFGEKIDVVLGISDDRLYVAAGRDAVKMLKEAISKSKAAAGKEIPPGQIVVAAGPIARFIAEAADNPMAKQAATMISGLLANSAGKDHITMTNTAVPQGFNMRLEIEEGLLKMAVTASRMAGPGGPGQMQPPGGGNGKPPAGNGPSPF